MGLALKRKNVILQRRQETIEFEQAIGASIVGVSAFNASFPNFDTHWVHAFGLSLQTSPSGKQISVTPSFTLEDSDGHYAADGCSIDVSAVAWLGQSPAQSVVFGERDGIPAGSELAPISLSGKELVVKSSLLRGFRLEYSPPDHFVERIFVGTGQRANTNNTEEYLTADADMHDGSGNVATTKLVSAGFIGAGASALLEIRRFDLYHDQIQRFPFDKPIKEAAVLLTGFDIYDGPGQMVANILVAGYVDKTGEKEVTVSGRARFEDMNHHKARTGRVSLLLLVTQ